jgi:hypothetical protein
MIIRKISFATIFTALSILGLSGWVSARENVTSSAHKTQKITAATVGCQPAISAIDLDINNVAARLMTGGDMWWNIGEQVAAYEVPASSGKSSQFAASCWIGGIDQQGQLKVAAQTYRQDGNDYWPGALDESGKITSDVCANWDKFWKIDRSTINTFIQLFKTHGTTTGTQFDVINQWPAIGNPNATGANGFLTLDPNHTYAPFVDVDKNGIYDPSGGDYPDINGDQYIWWVFNDAGNVKQQSLTAAIGVEVQTSGFAYATQDYLNDATFYNYRVINRGALTIDSTYIAVWDDCDLGYYYDDFIGCDTADGLGIQYNGTNDDGGSAGHPVNSYGVNPPQVGLNYFKGPLRPIHYARPGKTDSIYLKQLQMTNFTYYNNDFSEIGNPTNGVQIYYYMTGSIRTGQRFSDDFQGPGVQSKGYGSGPVSNFVFTGDPGNKTTWSECTCDNNPGDRRFIFSSGPFTLTPGAINDITFGCIWANGVGGCPNTSFSTIESIDKNAIQLFKSDFKTVEGPQAPRMVCRELDRKLVFYLVNDYGSNNYNENYGRTDKTSTANYADSIQYQQDVTGALAINSPDSLYKFEGYRVFQLANSQVTPAEIFDPTTGEVDNTKAIEVFQCDVRDSITTIINYVKNTAISDTTYVPQIKVQGKDSGISHSFEITQDQFSNTPDKTIVNYQNYYFVAIAYAYNDFSFNKTTGKGGFDPRNPTLTQPLPYLASAHGANGIAIPVVVGLPNPSNGAMGTIINSDYGSGIIVTRIEGQGNGGNLVELDPSSELTAINNGQVDSALYANSQGPINVKVIDPTLVPNYNWVMQINGANTTGTAGISDTGLWTLTAYQNGRPVDTIYSSHTIGSVNEQILEQYGLSVEINQVQAPGVNQANGNGYIGSSIQFQDQSQPWLWGVQDQADSVEANWLRSGNNRVYSSGPFNAGNPCNYNDYQIDIYQAYENLLPNFTPVKSTWGPYVLAAAYVGEHSGFTCSFEVAYSRNDQALNDTAGTGAFGTLPDVDVVFTSDKSKWTRCAVVEMEEDPTLAQGGAAKFTLRNHASWDLNWTGTNTPVYSTTPGDIGMSYFPGYAINVGTGQRLNIVFGEDSYLGGVDHGNDMLWNPSANMYSPFDGSVIWGGKHVVYISGTKYDSDAAFVNLVKTATVTNLRMQKAYATMQWVGIPVLNPSLNLLTIDQGIIPTQTRLQFRVDRPYAPYDAVDTSSLAAPVGIALTNGQKANPLYTFSTSNLAPTEISDTTNRSNLLSRIYAVPNPYYGYSGYETNRFDTKVRIINLPAQATIYIYALDGSLIRTLTKNDPTTSYIDWDIRNTVGLPIASGMYLMDVKANGIGETIVKWFGATRPIDVTSY